MIQARDSFRVIVSNSAKHHSFQTALAAAEAGVLDRFITEIYYKPNEWQYSWTNKLLTRTRPANAQRLLTRRSEYLDKYSISMPGLGLLTETVKRSPLIQGTKTVKTVNTITNELFDLLVAQLYVRPCDIFHGFEGCSMFAFEKAKSLGATLVLDQPIVHIDYLQKLELEECVRLGVALPKKPLLYHRDVQRKYEELGMADYIFVGLNFVKKSLVECGVPESKIFVIPYGADLGGQFQPVDRSSNKGSFTILYVGVVSWLKGLAHLLDAFSHLKLPNTKLVIVGKEQAHWGQYFRKRIAAIPNIEWIPGIPHTQIARLYAQADMLVFPSLVGGLGLVVYEAMSTGLPVIVSDGDIVIRDGLDGLVASPRHHHKLEEAILRLYTDRDLRKSLGQNAVLRAQEFNWRNYRRGIIQAYQQILEGGVSMNYS